MKKILIVTLFVAALTCLDLAFAGDKKKEDAAKKETSATEKMNPKKVPAGRTYVMLDAKGKEAKRFTAGQTTTLGTDCAQIKCPSSFGADVTCWKCVESLTTQ
jgi:hypothetical protein